MDTAAQNTDDPTPAVVDLIERFDRLQSARKVADEVKWSRDTVSKLLRPYRVLRRPIQLDVDEAVHRWNRGDPVAHIAADAGVGAKTVRINLRKKGWRVPNGGWVALRSLGADILTILRGLKEAGDPDRYYRQSWGLDAVLDSAIELGLVRQYQSGSFKVTPRGTEVYNKHVKDNPVGEMSESAYRALYSLEQKNRPPKQEAESPQDAS